MSGPRRYRWLLAPLLGSAVALAARRRNALSSSGALGAAAVGTAVFGAGGVPASTLLVSFFGSSTALSRVPHPRPLSLTRERGLGGEGVPAGPRRTLVQVLANGGLPATLAVWHGLRPSPRLHAAYAGALAAANADTWATEIGARSRTRPRSIVSGRPVEAGTSGGVTPLGTAASLAGALLIGAAYAAQARRPGAVARLGAAGLAGSLADSVLGATLQAVYRCEVCHARTENRAHAHDSAPPALARVRGLTLMTNDTVNLCASLVGALTGALLSKSG